MLMEADLPDDVKALRALVFEQARELDAVKVFKAEIARLKAIIEALQRHRFGRRSEQLDPDQFQLALEEVETALAQAEHAHEKASRVPAERVRKTNRGSLPAHLERIEQIVDVESRDCPCRYVYLDGSFVTAKPHPGDYDGCWEHVGDDPAKLDPVLLDFDNKRAAQKAKYLCQSASKRDPLSARKREPLGGMTLG